MPNMDGTGPRGLGSLTGRGLGPCNGGMRRGFGRGFGRRRGFRCVEPAALSEADQKKILEAELKDIDLEKQEIERRLKEFN
ncbi:hypothetical protein C4573_03275 [Candidatus Woesearchaeota archaeon]|nr:MAG: hypothetical protein C4573_03275 [Candidatus Woesearchaeota archaeon]